jgi:hypothetical protein
LNNPAFLKGIHSYYGSLDKFSQVKIGSAINAFKRSYCQLTGTGSQILKAAESLLPDLLAVDPVSGVADFIKKVSQDFQSKSVEPVVAALVLGEFYLQDKTSFKKAVNYSLLYSLRRNDTICLKNVCD